MFKRDVYSQMEAWRGSPRRKPLILRGARQVGKTTVVEQFGQNYANYLPFNLEETSWRNLFEMGLPIDDLLELAFARSGKIRQAGDTLLFIDEIQNSPKTIALLRYFYEKRPDIHVIAAGSLLENVIDVQASFPVGRVQYLPVRPCSFREFVRALGKDFDLQLLETPEHTIPFHNELLSLFNQYFIVGGMPEAVQAYAMQRDVLALDDIYETLLQAYRDDVEKYARGGRLLTDVIRFILAYGWQAAGETITLTGFGNSNYKSREVGEAFRLLEKAMLLELVYPTTSTLIPAVPEMKRKPKLFWFDTGLINYAAHVRKEILGSTDILDVWRGRLAEQMVGQELLTLSNKVSQHRCFWTKGNGKNGAEVDLVWEIDANLIPIEVKTGQNSHLRSLHSFVDNAPIDIAVRVWSGPYSVSDVMTTEKKKPFRLVNIPFYLVNQLETIVRRL